MSTPAHPARVGLVSPGVIAAGIALVLLRLRLQSLGGTPRIAGLIVVLLTILAVSLVVPVERGVPHLNPGLALTVGLGAVALAALAGGRPVPAPLTAWALPLTTLAAIAEEALFRRAMYGAVERHGAATAVGLTALVFALAHVPLYGMAVFPVDLGAGLVLSWQRWASGSWTVPAATHAAANIVMTVLR